MKWRVALLSLFFLVPGCVPLLAQFSNDYSSSPGAISGSPVEPGWDWDHPFDNGLDLHWMSYFIRRGFSDDSPAFTLVQPDLNTGSHFLKTQSLSNTLALAGSEPYFDYQDARNDLGGPFHSGGLGVDPPEDILYGDFDSSTVWNYHSNVLAEVKQARVYNQVVPLAVDDWTLGDNPPALMTTATELDSIRRQLLFLARLGIMILGAMAAAVVWIPLRP